MPTTEPTGPSIAQAERRAERAQAPRHARVDALEYKLRDARQTLDLGAQIANHPWPAVGIAFTLGALAGLAGDRRGTSGPAGTRSLTGAALGMLAAFGLRLTRELAMGQLRRAAQEWWLHHDRGSPRPAPATAAGGPTSFRH